MYKKQPGIFSSLNIKDLYIYVKVGNRRISDKS